MVVQAIGSRDFYNSEMPVMEDYVLRLFGLPMHVIMTFHEAAEEAADSTDENPKFTGKVVPFPVRHGRMLRYFSEVWRVQRHGPVPTIQLIPDYRFESAATNLIVGNVEKPDITWMLERHRENLAKGLTQLTLFPQQGLEQQIPSQTSTATMPEKPSWLK